VSGNDSQFEPEEPDPEADLPDYESELVDVPEPPSAPDPTENLTDGDVPRYVSEYFWRTLLIVDYAIAAVAIGPMVAYFEGDLRLGAGITASGLFAFGYAYVLYRGFKRTSEAHDDSDAESGGTNADEADAAADRDADSAAADDADPDRDEPVDADRDDAAPDPDPAE
jgi:hypothetical protein